MKLGEFLTLLVIRMIYFGKLKRLNGGAGGIIPSSRRHPGSV
jgi:hypothetical protein